MQQLILPRKWTGYFRFGTAYSLNLQLLRVAFELELNFNGFLFDGICTDEYTAQLFSSPAHVKGEYDEHTIQFVKKYPALLAIDDSDKAYVDHSQPSAPILYKGKIRKHWWTRRLYATGIWTITVLVPDYNGSPVTHTVDGRWKMWASTFK
ncbi:MAG: hypothetical protein KA821_05395 [Chitinophagaceae bacterium]|nr:hypothetical protein [Chitinophagaceae bacterium]